MPKREVQSNRIHISGAWGFDLRSLQHLFPEVVVLRTKNNGDDVMDTCVVCGLPIIKSVDVKANGYLNAVPWIQIRFVKVVRDKDEVQMEVQVCSTRCLAKFGNLSAGTVEPV